jgi:hypothetical protein
VLGHATDRWKYLEQAMASYTYRDVAGPLSIWSEWRLSPGVSATSARPRWAWGGDETISPPERTEIAPGVAERARRANILCLIRALHLGGRPRRVASPPAPWTGNMDNERVRARVTVREYVFLMSYLHCVQLSAAIMREAVGWS